MNSHPTAVGVSASGTSSENRNMFREGNVPVGSEARSGNVTVWAIVGVIWVAIMLNAWTRWVMSPTEFAAVPINTADVFDPAHLLGLRILEGVSVLAFLFIFWKFAIQPRLKTGTFGLDAMLLVGVLFGVGCDGFINLKDHLYAFNNYSINRGSWAAFMPFHTGQASSRYAEALLWALPMYMGAVLYSSWGGCAMIAALRRRIPSISNASAYSLVFLVLFLGGAVTEIFVYIRWTEAEMYPRTYAALTLFAGEWYQFPIYESILTAVCGLAFTVIRQSAFDSPNGYSCVERGAERLSPQMRGPVRLLAVIGASAAIFALGYFLPYEFLGLIADSIAPIPSYMQLG